MVNAVTMHLISLWALVVMVVCQHKCRVYAHYSGVNTRALPYFRLPI